jgi:hypothetical protein
VGEKYHSRDGTSHSHKGTFLLPHETYAMSPTAVLLLQRELSPDIDHVLRKREQNTVCYYH